jgi:hypothetical protein
MGALKNFENISKNFNTSGFFRSYIYTTMDP